MKSCQRGPRAGHRFATGRGLVVALVVTTVCMTMGILPAVAQSTGSADPVSTWDHTVNPAGWGLFPDAMAFGITAEAGVDSIAAAVPDLSGAALSSFYGTNGFLYHYAVDGGVWTHELTTAVHVNRVASFGWRMRWDQSVENDVWGIQDFGMMLRPASFVSVALGLDDAFDRAGDGMGLSIGLAVRPLAFNPSLETMLTLSADGSLAGGGSSGTALDASFDSIGARFILNDWLSVHGRWQFADGGELGIGLTLAVAGLESGIGWRAASGVMAGTAGSGSGDASVAQAIRLGRTTRAAERLFGKSLLVLDEPGFFAALPPLVDVDMGLGDIDIWLGKAIDAIERATTDPSISGLVMIEPPFFESDARGQEFGRALRRFRDSGKPVYVYATTMDRLSYVYAAAGAQLVAVDPNGMLALTDVASFSLYLKRLFDRFGIDTYNLQSHDTKTAYNSFTEPSMTEAERAMKRRFVDGLAGQAWAWFDASMAARRTAAASAKAGDTASGTATGSVPAASPAAAPAGTHAISPPTGKDAVGKGPYLDPRDAVKAGLVDALMYREEFDRRVDELSGITSRTDLRGYARERTLSWGQPPGKRVAVIYLSGSIIDGEGVAGQSIGEATTDLLRSLRDDPFIAGIILRVDSGGGSARTSDHIAREVRELRAAGKPVVVSMGSYAASGGYYISADADTILAEQGTLTGSIGVTGLDFNLTRMLDKLEVGTGSVVAGDSGAFGNPMEPRRAQDAERMVGYITYVYDRFVDVVAAGRSMERSKVDELGKGQIWLGSEAVANGLVDAIGGLDEAKAAMVRLLGSPAVYVDYLPGSMEWDSLLGALGSTLLRGTAAQEGSGMFATLQGALDLATEIDAMGPGPLYLAPEYLYRTR